MPKVLIAGCGYLGRSAAGLFLQSGWEVTALTHTTASATALRAEGISALPLDFAAPNAQSSLMKLGEFDAVLHTASSGGGGLAAYERVYRQGLENVLSAFPRSRILFTSSTSVHGQTDGSWVEESSATNPASAISRVLLSAEEGALAARGIVARVAGIYGPGRSIYQKKFLSGEAILEEGGLRWINQIHRDDAARALVHLICTEASGIYNVVDDHPCTQRDIYAWLADHYRLPMPAEGPRDLNRKRAWTSKRVSNAKLRATGWTPLFPSYREGIPDVSRP